MSKRTRLGVPAVVGSALAIGSLVGADLVRSVVRRDLDPMAGEDFALMDADRARTVCTDDGVELVVREVGPADAPVTVVFVHGFCLDMTSWHFQRRALAQRWGDGVRMVFYDQRGHGASESGTSQSCTIAQLGDDLSAVVEQTAPTGPVVLVGHSMGGMTILGFASRHADVVADRVRGVVLLSTTTVGLSRTGLTASLDNPVIDALRFAVRTSPGTVQRARGAARRIITPILRAASYGTAVSPSVQRFSNGILDRTSVVTIVDFLRTLEVHDETAALDVLRDVPAVVLSGDADMVIPFRASRTLADALTDAELVRVRRAGHLVQLEFPHVVTEAIDRCVRRVPAKQEQAHVG
ncbi:alpha/beta hydrolase [Rhodococcus sp. HNM0569]|uniref:alpha/beta fold hydrolase n=1 Tax=Rhodococcus sp. HNM0569 TaxID=2716340 RepID=UPI00146E877B|nr:alpha/beta hydrolase [Rhodococcus sp. HNM0569]NLU81777.1 alpha/beta hydrolase [Rhodococcus sp. HNM0569]